MKNIIITALLLLFFLSHGVSAYTEKEKTAADILSYNSIIVSQDDPDKYNLDNEISRREMAKVTLNLSGEFVEDKCNGDFNDMKSSDWGCKYAESGVQQGFFALNDIFRPDDNISKIEALKMVMKGKNIEREDTEDWRIGYVNAAFESGLIDEKFVDYDTFATRGWIFVTAQHAIEYSSDETIQMLIDLLES